MNAYVITTVVLFGLSAIGGVIDLAAGNMRPRTPFQVGFNVVANALMVMAGLIAWMQP